MKTYENVLLLPLNVRSVPVIRNGKTATFDARPLGGCECILCVNNGEGVPATMRDKMGVPFCEPCWLQIAMESP
jgi:hypothetical protein